jgi:porin
VFDARLGTNLRQLNEDAEYNVELNYSY